MIKTTNFPVERTTISPVAAARTNPTRPFAPKCRVLLAGVVALVGITSLQAALPGARSAVSGNDIFLEGNYISVGISGSGSFGTANDAPSGFHPIFRNNLGLSADQDGFDTGNAPTTGDFFLPGSPEERFVVGFKISGTSYNFSNAERVGVTDLPRQSMSNLSSGNTLRAQWVGITSDGRLKVTQVVSFDVNARCFKNTVTLQNVSGGSLDSVRYMRSFDPDPDADMYGAYETYNMVVSQEPTSNAIVRAIGSVSGIPIFFLATDSRARVSTFGFANGDVFDTAAYDSPTVTGLEELVDQAISICFDVGTLTTGASTTVEYYTSFPDNIDNPLNTILNASDVSFDPIQEDAATINGQTVLDVFTTPIAVTWLDNTNGLWQYSLNSGPSWNDFAAAGAQDIITSARLLATNHMVRFVPNTNYNGTATMKYRVWDPAVSGTAGSTANASTGGGVTAFSANVATASQIVTPVNDAPIAFDDSYSTAEDTALIVAARGVLANDTDIDGDTLSAVLVSGPAHGSLTLNANGSFTYRPAANYNGADSFTYRAIDGTTNSTAATVSLTVSPVDDPPVLATSSGNSAYVEDATGSIVDPGLTITDPDGGTIDGATVAIGTGFASSQDSLSFTAQSGITGSYHAASGILILQGPGTAADYQTMLRSVTYLNSSQNPSTATRTITFSLGKNSLYFSGNNHYYEYVAAPAITWTNAMTRAASVANYGQAGYPSGVFGLRGYLVTITTAAENTFVASKLAGQGWIGTSDRTSEGAWYWVTGPEAGRPFWQGTGTNGFALQGMYNNWRSGEPNDWLNGSPGEDFAHFCADGRWNDYTYDNGTIGGYVVEYGGMQGDPVPVITASRNLTVTSVNDAPVATDDSYSTAEDIALTVAAPGVLANDIDFENDTLSAVLVSEPAHGSVTLNANGSFTYTPSANYCGSDSFTYKANDGDLDSGNTTVSLTVTAVNDAPVATGDSYSTTDNTALTVAAPGVLANDTDIDGDTLSAVLVSEPAHGSVTLNADGSFTYTPSTNYYGSDSFTYKANDGALDSDNTTVSLTVTVAPESIPPAVKIMGPKSGLDFDTNVITVFGTAADISSGVIAEVLVRVNGEDWQSATMNRPMRNTANWNNTVTLYPGTNTVQVKAVDMSGNESLTDNRSFFLAVRSLFTLGTSGFGSVRSVSEPVGTPTNGALLKIGCTYTVMGVPDNNHLFNNWTCVADGVTNVVWSAAQYTFLMQSNLTLIANFVTNRFYEAAGSYLGLFSEPVGVAHQSSGFFKLKVNTKGRLTGRFWAGGESFLLSGILSPEGNCTATPVLRRQQGMLTASLTVDLAGGDIITGTVSNANGWSADLLGDRVVWKLPDNPATNFLGKYTMIMPGHTNAAESPGGDSYGLIRVKTNGVIVFSGAVADGLRFKVRPYTPFLAPATLSKNGYWPFYATLYPSSRTDPATGSSVKIFNGSILGWLCFTNGSLEGTLYWSKLGWTNGFYNNGFTNELSILASPYTPPAPDHRALNLTNGTIVLKDGNLTCAFTNNNTWNTDNRITVTTPNHNTQSLKISVATGLAKSFFNHPDIGNETTPVMGVLLQNQNVVRGFFLGTNQSGSFRLQGN